MPRVETRHLRKGDRLHLGDGIYAVVTEVQHNHALECPDPGCEWGCEWAIDESYSVTAEVETSGRIAHWSASPNYPETVVNPEVT